MPRKNPADQSSKADLKDAQALLRLHNSNDVGNYIIAIEAESNFWWSDDSWDPMDQEIVAIYKSRYDAEIAMEKNSVPIGQVYRALHRGLDLHEIPVSEDVQILNAQLLYLVFATEYYGIRNYDDSEGRIHDSYRTDGTGRPIKAFINRDSALQFVDELNYEYRVLRPRGIFSSPHYRWLSYRPPHGLSFGHSIDEWTTLSEEEFCKKLMDVDSEKYRNLTSEEFTWYALFGSQLEDNALGSPEETSILDAKTRRIWELMDRVVLFKMVPMSMENRWDLSS